MLEWLKARHVESASRLTLPEVENMGAHMQAGANGLNAGLVARYCETDLRVTGAVRRNRANAEDFTFSILFQS